MAATNESDLAGCILGMRVADAKNGLPVEEVDACRCRELVVSLMAERVETARERLEKRKRD